MSLFCDGDMLFDPDRKECLECGENDDTIALYKLCQEQMLNSMLEVFDFSEESKTPLDEDEEEIEETPDTFDILTKEPKREI